MSRARCQWHLETAVNQQALVELSACYAYHALWAHFARDDVAMPNVAAFFKKSSDEEREHAHKFMEYQISRGGRVALNTIPQPDLAIPSDSSDVLCAFEMALQLEKEVDKHIRILHAEAVDDPHLAGFLESEFLGEQVQAIQMLAQCVAQLTRISGDGAGLLEWDRALKLYL